MQTFRHVQRVGAARRDALQQQRAGIRANIGMSKMSSGVNPMAFMHQRVMYGRMADCILKAMAGPKGAHRLLQNYHWTAKKLRINEYYGLPSTFELYNERMRPEKDLPHGQKFFSRRASSLEDYMPQVENPYDDGRNFCISSAARTVDLLPFVLHEVDDRISEAKIRRDVKAIAELAPTIADFIDRQQQWGWEERAEALSSRVVVYHIRCLAQVISSQEKLRGLRKEFSENHAVLRVMDGSRFYAFPGTEEARGSRAPLGCSV
eukprot:TRINITY_DN32175_c0_g1_i1.p1 TRINITY_DN32175_c0_g1~~TRINITY_DN32175_c0_g1_i1.p1  ORF type:complete len:280 (+),score=95.34 TRINITY_DN32175_c0_g1_i1:53-841(+)